MKKLIESERLCFREFKSEDTQAIYELHNNKLVMKYMPGFRSTDHSKSVGFINDCKNYYLKNPGLGIWPTLLKNGNKLIGWTTLKHLANTEEIEIGYRYFPEYWDKGFCTEISSKLVEYGFSKILLNRIVGITHPDNKASIRVLEKLGFKFEKETQYYGMDVVYFALKR